MKNNDNVLITEAYNPLKHTQDLSKAIDEAEQNMKNNKLYSLKTTHSIALNKAKILLTQIEKMIEQKWLIPNDNISEHSNPAYANLKNQIKKVLKNINNSTED